MADPEVVQAVLTLGRCCRVWLPDLVLPAGPNLKLALIGKDGANLSHLRKGYPGAKFVVSGEASTTAKPDRKLHIAVMCKDRSTLDRVASDVADLAETACDLVADDLGLDEDQVQEAFKAIRVEKFALRVERYDEEHCSPEVPSGHASGVQEPTAADMPEASAAHQTVQDSAVTSSPIAGHSAAAGSSASAFDFEAVEDESITEREHLLDGVRATLDRERRKLEVQSVQDALRAAIAAKNIHRLQSAVQKSEAIGFEGDESDEARKILSMEKELVAVRGLLLEASRRQDADALRDALEDGLAFGLEEEELKEARHALEELERERERRDMEREDPTSASKASDTAQPLPASQELGTPPGCPSIEELQIAESQASAAMSASPGAAQPTWDQWFKEGNSPVEIAAQTSHKQETGLSHWDRWVQDRAQAGPEQAADPTWSAGGRSWQAAAMPGLNRQVVPRGQSDPLALQQPRVVPPPKSAPFAWSCPSASSKVAHTGAQLRPMDNSSMQFLGRPSNNHPGSPPPMSLSGTSQLDWSTTASAVNAVSPQSAFSNQALTLQHRPQHGLMSNQLRAPEQAAMPQQVSLLQPALQQQLLQPQPLLLPPQASTVHPMPRQTPWFPREALQQQVPMLSQTSTMLQRPMAQQVPMTQQTSMLQQTPMSQQSMMLQQASFPQETVLPPVAPARPSVLPIEATSMSSVTASIPGGEVPVETPAGDVAAATTLSELLRGKARVQPPKQAGAPDHVANTSADMLCSTGKELKDPPAPPENSQPPAPPENSQVQEQARKQADQLARAAHGSVLVSSQHAQAQAQAKEQREVEQPAQPPAPEAESTKSKQPERAHSIESLPGLEELQRVRAESSTHSSERLAASEDKAKKQPEHSGKMLGKEEVERRQRIAKQQIQQKYQTAAQKGRLTNQQQCEKSLDDDKHEQDQDKQGGTLATAQPGTEHGSLPRAPPKDLLATRTPQDWYGWKSSWEIPTPPNNWISILYRSTITSDLTTHAYNIYVFDGLEEVWSFSLTYPCVVFGSRLQAAHIADMTDESVKAQHAALLLGASGHFSLEPINGRVHLSPVSAHAGVARYVMNSGRKLPQDEDEAIDLPVGSSRKVLGPSRCCFQFARSRLIFFLDCLGPGDDAAECGSPRQGSQASSTERLRQAPSSPTQRRSKPDTQPHDRPRSPARSSHRSHSRRRSQPIAVRRARSQSRSRAQKTNRRSPRARSRSLSDAQRGSRKNGRSQSLSRAVPHKPRVRSRSRSASRRGQRSMDRSRSRRGSTRNSKAPARSSKRPRSPSYSTPVAKTQRPSVRSPSPGKATISEPPEDEEMQEKRWRDEENAWRADIKVRQCQTESKKDKEKNQQRQEKRESGREPQREVLTSSQKNHDKEARRHDHQKSPEGRKGSSKVQREKLAATSKHDQRQRKRSRSRA